MRKVKKIIMGLVVCAFVVGCVATLADEPGINEWTLNSYNQNL